LIYFVKKQHKSSRKVHKSLQKAAFCAIILLEREGKTMTNWEKLYAKALSAAITAEAEKDQEALDICGQIISCCKMVIHKQQQAPSYRITIDQLLSALNELHQRLFDNFTDGEDEDLEVTEKFMDGIVALFMDTFNIHDVDIYREDGEG
jgi:hypothetical protein